MSRRGATPGAPPRDGLLLIHRYIRRAGQPPDVPQSCVALSPAAVDLLLYCGSPARIGLEIDTGLIEKPVDRNDYCRLQTPFHPVVLLEGLVNRSCRIGEKGLIM